MSMSIFFVGHHISHYVGYHIGHLAGHLVCIHVGHNVRLHVDFFLATNRKLVTRLLVEYIVLPRRNIVCAYWCNAVWQPSVFHQNAQIIDPLIFIILFCFLYFPPDIRWNREFFRFISTSRAFAAIAAFSVGAYNCLQLNQNNFEDNLESESHNRAGLCLASGNEQGTGSSISSSAWWWRLKPSKWTLSPSSDDINLRENLSPLIYVFIIFRRGRFSRGWDSRNNYHTYWRWCWNIQTSNGWLGLIDQVIFAHCVSCLLLCLLPVTGKKENWSRAPACRTHAAISRALILH